MHRYSKCLGIVVLCIALVVSGCSRRLLLPRAEAVAPVAIAAALGISYEALQGLMLATAAAVAIGAISQSQQASYDKKLMSAINSIKSMAADATEQSYAVWREVTDGLGAKSKAKTKTNTAPGECDPSKRNDPRQCCQNFMESFEGKGMKDKKFYISSTGNGSWKVYSHDKPGQLCCLNWDSKHGRFEVYHKGGEGKYRDGEKGDAYDHKGEMTCSERNIDNPCEADMGDKADNATGKHAPRGGCEQFDTDQSGEGSGSGVNSNGASGVPKSPSGTIQ
jgi:hypothetical protein